MISSAAMSIETLNCGNFCSAAATILIAQRRHGERSGAFGRSLAWRFRTSSNPVMSAESYCVTSATCAHDDPRCSPVFRRMRASLTLDRAPLAEIGQRLGGHTWPAPPAGAAPSGRNEPLRMRLHVFDRNTSIAVRAGDVVDVDAEFARHSSHRRRGRCGGPDEAPCGGGSTTGRTPREMSTTFSGRDGSAAPREAEAEAEARSLDWRRFRRRGSRSGGSVFDTQNRLTDLTLSRP